MYARKNSIRRRLSSSLGLALSLLYLFGPIRHDIGEKLHDMAHWVESIYPLEAQHTANRPHSHTYSDHRLSREIHSHEGLMWVDQLLQGASQPADKEKTLVAEPGIDKHLPSGAYGLTLPTDSTTQISRSLIPPLPKGQDDCYFRPPRA